jgi:hypothetical protein
MPAGKIAVSGGVGSLSYIPYGVSVRSLRRHARPRVAIPSCHEVQRLRRYLRDTFKIYALDRATQAPTATERRRTLVKIKTSAARLVSIPNRPNAYALLDALETRDYDALNLAYGALTAKGHNPMLFKRRLRHWGLDPFHDQAAISAAHELTNLDVEALAPVSGRFPDPALAHLVASLPPIWKRVTGRTAGLISAENNDAKTCPFADWLGEIHDLLRVPRPPVGRVADIVRRE